MLLNFRSYPPAGHAERIRDYTRYEKLFLGKHRELYARTPSRFKLARYVVANFAGVISRLAADLLFGEPPDFLAPSDDAVADRALNNAQDLAEGKRRTSTGEGQDRTRQDREARLRSARAARAEDPRQAAIDRIVNSNDIHTLNYESALSNSFRGDAVYKVRLGNRTPNAAAPEALVEEVPPAIYFPEFDEDNLRQVVRVTLAWIKRNPANPNETFVRIEEHEPGFIRNRLIQQSGADAGTDVGLQAIEAYADLLPEVETKLEVIPVFHIPNYRFGSRFWGLSDYHDLEPIFEAINNRLSQTDDVLEKHVNPKIIVHSDLLDEDGKLKFEDMEIVQVNPGEQPPTLLTWEGQLSASAAYVDRLMELLFMQSETAPAAFGMDKYGTAESGRALKLKLQRTIAKISRKRLYYDRALKAAILAAQQLEVAHGLANYEPAEPIINWADGLPEDMVEMVEMEAMRLNAGNTSVESSIRRLDGPDAVDDEMARIEEEDGQAAAVTGAGRSRGGRNVPPPLPGSDRRDQGSGQDQGADGSGSDMGQDA